MALRVRCLGKSRFLISWKADGALRANAPMPAHVIPDIFIVSAFDCFAVVSLGDFDSPRSGAFFAQRVDKRFLPFAALS